MRVEVTDLIRCSRKHLSGDTTVNPNDAMTYVAAVAVAVSKPDHGGTVSLPYHLSAIALISFCCCFTHVAAALPAGPEGWRVRGDVSQVIPRRIQHGVQLRRGGELRPPRLAALRGGRGGALPLLSEALGREIWCTHATRAAHPFP
jgi:hypothetical protein